MAIRPITPSFKGLIVTPDSKTAINTKYITSMQEYEKPLSKEVATTIYTLDNKHLDVKAPLNEILEAYSITTHEDSIDSI